MENKESLDLIAKYIEKETGIVFHENSFYQLKNRLDDIIKSENLTSVNDIVKIIQQPFIQAKIKQKITDSATNNETLFFRDPVFFNSIEKFIVDEVLPKRPTEIKIWSAASSTGQEAISLMITLDELAKKANLPKITILATDICEKALIKAKSGVYTDFEVMRGLSDERKNKYFIKQVNGWKVKDEILSKIKYEYNNLIKSTVNEKFNLILCRNVLIYQKVELKKEVVSMLFNQIAPDGAVLFGVGETLLGVKDDVATQYVDKVLFYKKKLIQKIA